jgi:hypothetical protein
MTDVDSKQENIPILNIAWQYVSDKSVQIMTLLLYLYNRSSLDHAELTQRRIMKNRKRGTICKHYSKHCSC